MPPQTNVTRKTVRSPHRGAEFRKTLTEIEKMARKQVKGSNHVFDGHVATVYDQENALKLKRISEIAEEQLTHAASLAGMPA